MKNSLTLFFIVALVRGIFGLDACYPVCEPGRHDANRPRQKTISRRSIRPLIPPLPKPPGVRPGGGSTSTRGRNANPIPDCQYVGECR